LHADLGVGLVVLSQSFLKSALLAPGECVNPPHTKQKARAEQAGPLRSTLSNAGQFLDKSMPGASAESRLQPQCSHGDSLRVGGSGYVTVCLGCHRSGRF
jgi:hypothetical protein